MARKNKPLNWTSEDLGDLTGRTYVITGTTTGIGHEAVRLLLAKNASIVMLNRNTEKAKVVARSMKEEFGKDANVTSITLDLARLDSVRAAAKTILKEVPRIDALICNAAIAQIATQEFTEDGFETHMGVNHYANFLLCSLLFDRIEESGGRVVVVGSLAYRQGIKEIKFDDLDYTQKYTPWNAYAHSKLAAMTFTFELERRVKKAGRNVQVLACHPGASKTDLIKGDNVSTLVKVFWRLTAPLIAQPASHGAWPEVMCATEDNLDGQKLYGPSKRGGLVGPVSGVDPVDFAIDKEIAAKLWNVSEEKTAHKWLI